MGDVCLCLCITRTTRGEQIYIIKFMNPTWWFFYRYAIGPKTIYQYATPKNLFTNMLHIWKSFLATRQERL